MLTASAHSHAGPDFLASSIAWCVGLMLLVLPVFARAGVVRTLDGKTYEGQIVLEDQNQLGVRTRDGSAIRLALEDIFCAQFGAAVPTPAAPSGRWIGRDIGRVSTAGSARFTADTVTVRGSGMDMSGATDSGYYVYQTVEGDAQIVARLAALQQTDRYAKGGLMIRAATDPVVPYAMVLAQAGGGLRFQYRSKVASHAQGTDSPNTTFPCWLKLIRKGNTLSGYYSADARNWELLAAETVSLPATIQIGLAVCARSRSALCAATFERVAVSTTASRTDRSFVAPSRGIVLRQGSMLTGKVRSANESVLRFERDGELTVPVAEVARMYFATLTSDLAPRLPPGRKGVLLASGDFFEGNVLAVEGGRVKLSSVLFGLQHFDTGQVVAVVLRDVSPVAARYEVRTADGSVLLADRLSVDRSALGVQDRSFGVVKFTGEQIVEIRVGAARFVWLSDLRPARIEMDEPRTFVDIFASDRANSLAPMSLAGQLVQRGMAILAGGAATYEIDGSYSLLLLRVGVPDSVLPVNALTFVILGDGKELYRSAPRTSLDEPLVLTLKISTVKSVVLRVESPPGGMVGGVALFADAAVVK